MEYQPLFSIAALLLLSVQAPARSHSPEESMDSVKGVAIASRLPCDGSTNFQEEVKLHTEFSSGGMERSFHLDQFEAQYCKHLDLYFWCAKKGYNRWQPEWSSDSSHPAETPRYWLNSCAEHGSKELPKYILSGWYKESADPKLPWKQATVKRVSESPEVYEFTDSNGGTARLTVERK